MGLFAVVLYLLVALTCFGFASRPHISFVIDCIIYSFYVQADVLIAGVANTVSANASASSIKQSETLTNVSADFRASTIQLSADNRASIIQLSADNRANTADFCATTLSIVDKFLTYQAKRSRRYDDDDDGDSDNEDDAGLKPAARKKQKR